MKISIAYLPEEEREAGRAVSALLQLHPGARIHKSEAHPPFKHTYVTTKRPLERPQSIALQGIPKKEGTPHNGRSGKEAP